MHFNFFSSRLRSSDCRKRAIDEVREHILSTLGHLTSKDELRQTSYFTQLQAKCFILTVEAHCLCLKRMGGKPLL